MRRFEYASFESRELHTRVVAALSAERGGKADALGLLGEILARRTFVPEGFADPRDYCVRALGMSQDQAFRRLRAARTVHTFPALLPAVADGRLSLVLGDALEVDEAALSAGAPAAIVSNLPYNVGTPLLIKWLTGPYTPVSQTLMFQKEVAERIVAAPGSDAYGRLAVIAQACAEARLVMDVPARAFTPPPKVASAVVRLVPRADRPEPVLLGALQKITQAAFGQRRKMLRSSLKPLGGEALCVAAGLAADARAETIDIPGFLALAQAWLDQR